MTQDLQENVESVQSFSVPTKIIEGKVDDNSVTSPHEENIQYINIYGRNARYTYKNNR